MRDRRHGWRLVIWRRREILFGFLIGLVTYSGLEAVTRGLVRALAHKEEDTEVTALINIEREHENLHRLVSDYGIRQDWSSVRHLLVIPGGSG